ncbi:MAG: tetratricopeptide repeat protein [Chloroflexi bacterium]|nr:tetratricopeptide repeat protein [Chloroflexota bacterium]
MTPFVGRERELQEIARVLADPAARLITLAGIGGMGKTRLAIEIAKKCREQFAHGAAFVALMAVTTGDSIVPAIADALGFGFYESDDPRTQLINYLREKQLLLVLDNLEHLVGDAKALTLIEELLRDAPRVKILATSREPLAVQSEWLFELDGLGDQAVTLFEQSACRAQSGFQSCEDDRSSIARICQLVGGMPLGIELAASWVRVLSCAEIAQEIERHLDFLTTSARDVPERHRSMRAVFDQSWRLLSKDERHALSRLSVFRGGFRRDAAEQIADANLTVLSALVTKSLVRRVEANRYDLHELVRQYAVIRLAENAPEQAETLDRRGVFYLKQFAEQENVLNSPAQTEVIKEQTREMGNVRAAWHHAGERGEFSLIGQTLNSFLLFYEVRGWFREAIEQIEVATNALRARPTSAPDLMGQLLNRQAWFRFRCGQYGAARELSKQGLALLRPLGPQSALANASLFGAIIAYRAGELSAAQQLADEGLTTARAIHTDWLIAFGLCVQGIVAQAAGRHSEAYDHLRAGPEGFRAVGSPHLIGFALNYLAPITLDLGRIAEAQVLLEESLAMNQRADDRWGLGTCYGNLGLVAQARGDLNAARSLFRQAVDTFDELGARGYTAEYLVHLGAASAAMGDAAEAKKIFRDAIRLASQAQAMLTVADGIVGLTGLLAREAERPEHLVEWLQVVESHPATHAATRERAVGLRAELSHLIIAQPMETMPSPSSRVDHCASRRGT